MVNYFVDCKHGRKKIAYEHPMLEPILKETYGVIVYQEQVMRIASTLAGFSLGEADILRKAMGKKDKEAMAKQSRKFLEGAKQNDDLEGHGREDLRPHGEVRGVRIQQVAQRGVRDDLGADGVPQGELPGRVHGGEPHERNGRHRQDHDPHRGLPDERVSRSFPRTSTGAAPSSGPRTVRSSSDSPRSRTSGLSAVKHIIEEREENGPYRSLFDLCRRIAAKAVNRRVIESLIQSGALDSLPGHRAQKLQSLAVIHEKTAKSSRDAERGQFALFGEESVLADDKLEECEPWSALDELRREKESLGFFLSGHPLDKYKGALDIFSTMTTSGLKTGSNGKHVVVGGVVTGVKNAVDKKQQPMAFVTVEDGEGQAEVMMFSDVLSANANVTSRRTAYCSSRARCRAGTAARENSSSSR